MAIKIKVGASPPKDDKEKLLAFVKDKEQKVCITISEGEVTIEDDGDADG